MNKVYRLINNHNSGTVQVAPETAHGHGHVAGSLAVILALLGAPVAHATDYMVSSPSTTPISLLGGDTLTVTSTGTLTAAQPVLLNNSADVVNTLNNAGSIAALATSTVVGGITNFGIINSLTNSGAISANGGTFLTEGISNIGTIIEFTNAGSIAASSSANNFGVANNGTITTFINIGTITGSGGNVGTENYGVSNMGTITTLINGQTTALAYEGHLPSNYYTYFNTPSSYGKISFSNLSGYALSNYGLLIASGQNYAVGTYNNVITSDFALTISSYEPVTGVTYHLVSPDGGHTWNLVIDSVSSSRVFDAASALGNGPAYNAAHVIDANANLLALFAPLTTNAQLSGAASQTLPLLTADGGQATLHVLGDINDIIQARNAANEGMSSGDNFLGDKKFWMKPFGSWSRQSDRDTVSGYKGQVGGLAIGADSAVSATSRLGVAIAYAHANVDSNSTTAPQSSRIDLYQLIGYGSHDLDPNTELNYQIDIGNNTNHGQRDILFASQTASSSYHTFTAHAGLGLSRKMVLASANIFIPSVRVDYTSLHDHAYGETGAGLLNLNVDSRTTEQMVFSVDGKLVHPLNDHTRVFANLGAGYDALAKQASLTSAFAGASGMAFTTYGMTSQRWMWRGGLGLQTMTTSGMEVTGRYDIEAQNGFTNQTVSAKLRWSF